MTTLPAISPGEPICNIGELPCEFTVSDLKKLGKTENGLEKQFSEELPVRFEAKLIKINSWTVIMLPAWIDSELPSRGAVPAEVTVAGAELILSWNRTERADTGLV